MTTTQIILKTFFKKIAQGLVSLVEKLGKESPRTEKFDPIVEVQEIRNWDGSLKGAGEKERVRMYPSVEQLCFFSSGIKKEYLLYPSEGICELCIVVFREQEAIAEKKHTANYKNILEAENQSHLLKHKL